MRKTYVTFQLNGQLYGVEILYVREINPNLDSTPVQHAPECIRGLANLRGQIVTIIDLDCKLGQPASTTGSGSCHLILRTDAELSPIRQCQGRPDLLSVPDSIGFPIDEVDEIVSLDDSEIEALPPNVEEVEARYLNGIAKLEDRLLSILDVPRLLTFEPQNPNALPLHPA